MKKIYYVNLILYCLFLLPACQQKGKTDLIEIPVNTEKEKPLSLSQISESITPIELELTDESLIQQIRRVIYTDKYLILLDKNALMVFDGQGHFIREISKKGEGPGEYLRIMDIAYDEQKEIIYMHNGGNIICYNIDGKFIKQSTNEYTFGFNNFLSYVNNELLLLVEYREKDEITKQSSLSTYIHKINNDLSKTDSILIRYITDPKAIWTGASFTMDYITQTGQKTYLYMPELINRPFLYDTIYQYQRNGAIPHLTLNFKNDGRKSDGEKAIYIHNIYRSSRYAFCSFIDNNKPGGFYFFCYDMHTEKGYLGNEGYIDDIHTGEKVQIRPFNSNADMFYYSYTNWDGEGDEPNPTLYIGRLKK